MSEFPSQIDAPEAAYRGFFRADNAQDPDAWAAVMSYPHVRVSATGRTAYFDTPEQYAAAANWAPRKATGWVRSEGVSPVRVHESADKVHLWGGWTRYNAADEPILTNRVTYVLTRLDGSWGIQARFGVDSFTGHDNAASASAAVDLVSRFVDAVREGKLDRSADLCRLPLVLVGVGKVVRVADAADFTALLTGQAAREPTILEIRTVQAGTDGAVVALTVDNPSGGTAHAVVVAGRRQDGWKIAGVSAITG